MKFFLDENFPKSADRLLKSRGHRVEDIRGTEKEGLKDKPLFEISQELKAIFFTTDKDFFHTVPCFYKKHFRIVVITMRQPNRENILSRLEWFLNFTGEKEICNKVFLLKDKIFTIYDTSE